MNNTLSPTDDRPAAANAANGAETPHLSPRVDIVERQDRYVLEAEMPGVNKSGLEILVENSELTILGRRAEAETASTAVYRESRPLPYRRVFDLDPSIDTTRISARIEQGLLTLELPKAEAVQPRKIQITD